MASAAELVSKAASQVGVKESPTGSNRVKYWDWYDKGMQGNPWCDCFVSWCAGQVGASAIVGKFAYCPSHVNFFKAAGCWHDRSATPKPGDIVFFSNGKRACHVGIVEKRIDANTIQTIEGNTSTTSNDNGGAVMRRTRKYGTVGSSWYVLGFGRPPYSGEKKTTTGGSVKDVQKWVGVSQDGGYGPKTKAALVRKLQAELNEQRKAGLAVDGKFGVKTKAACPALKNGSKGNITKVLQGALICHGHSIKFDGKYGDGTEAAVRKYQKGHSLKEDGVAGKNTFAALLG